MLVSQNLLASRFLQIPELFCLLNRASSMGLRILWLPISPSTVFETHEIPNYEALIDPRVSLIELSVPQRKMALVSVARRIATSFNENRTSKQL